jgi:hypothetical protein
MRTFLLWVLATVLLTNTADAAKSRAKPARAQSGKCASILSDIRHKGAAYIPPGLRCPAVGPKAAISRKPIIFHGLAFPKMVHRFERGETRDFEKTDPGAGYLVSYRRDSWGARVTIYDRSIPGIPDDPLSPVAIEEVRRDLGTLYSQLDAEILKDFKSKLEYNLPKAGRIRFQCATSTVVLNHEEDNADRDRYFCLTAWRGKFVSVILSRPPSPSNDAEAHQFIEAWIKILWPSGPSS